MTATSTPGTAASGALTPPAPTAYGPVHVVGATGKTGRRVAERLERLGMPVRGLSRGSTPPFDWSDRATWAPAVAGARALYVTYVPDLAVAGAVDDVAALVEVARAAGVEHLVLLSGRGEDGARRAEDVVTASGLAWTVVRASWFAQNFSEGALLPGVLDGVVALPVGDMPEPFVDLDDVADVVVAALTDPRHRGRLYEVTGPRALTFSAAVAEIARASGRDVRYVEMAAEDFRAAVAAEAGPEYANLLADLCAEVFDGRNVEPTTGVREALGREPRDFADWCRDAAAAWR